MIRFATLEDLKSLEELSYSFWKTSDYRGQTYDTIVVCDTLVKTIEQNNNESILLVSEEKNQIKGYLMAVSVNPLFSKEKTAYEIAYFCDTGCKNWYKLLEAYVFWAKKIGCQTAHLGSTNPRLTKILNKRLGFEPIETTLQKNLKEL
jgi:hypothetical protein